MDKVCRRIKAYFEKLAVGYDPDIVRCLFAGHLPDIASDTFTSVDLAPWDIFRHVCNLTNDGISASHLWTNITSSHVPYCLGCARITEVFLCVDDLKEARVVSRMAWAKCVEHQLPLATGQSEIMRAIAIITRFAGDHRNRRCRRELTHQVSETERVFVG
jgi:hypothetical protein